VAATRAVAGPDVPIMVDTNCAWLPDAATAAVMAMAPSKPLWVEEPIWPPEDFSSLAALRRATGVAPAAGENATGALGLRQGLPQDDCGRRRRLRAAERSEDRRAQRFMAHRQRGGGGQRHLRAARTLFRPRLLGDAARAGDKAARERARALLLRAGADALWRE